MKLRFHNRWHFSLIIFSAQIFLHYNKCGHYLESYFNHIKDHWQLAIILLTFFIDVLFCITLFILSTFAFINFATKLKFFNFQSFRQNLELKQDDSLPSSCHVLQFHERQINYRKMKTKKFKKFSHWVYSI